jgi:hypothetical protein
VIDGVESVVVVELADGDIVSGMVVSTSTLPGWVVVVVGITRCGR